MALGRDRRAGADRGRGRGRRAHRRGHRPGGGSPGARRWRLGGGRANLSFFAFTATPKARTLELFGTKNAATGKYEPFHLYSMRQAIEEGFILDVLANYTTYHTYWRIEKAVQDDPEYESAKAKQAIARFVSLHPPNLAQKAEIIVEHFRTHTAAQDRGRGQGDGGHLLPPPRRALQAGHRQLHPRQGLLGRGALVAFSGKVIDDDGVTWSRSRDERLPRVARRPRSSPATTTKC